MVSDRDSSSWEIKRPRCRKADARLGRSVLTMSISTLTIRNITSSPTELKVVERAQALPQLDNGTSIANIGRNITSLFTNTTSVAQVAPLVQDFVSQEVSLKVAVFETKTTDILVNPNETLRLTFETNGQRYQVDTPCSSERSTVLKALSPDPEEEYTAIYLPKFSYLALFSSAKLSSWMAELKDETPLSALSIPGTHNSHTYHIALPSVRCQAVSVRDQLKNGVRFLDIRLMPMSVGDMSQRDLALVHGAFPVALTGNKYFKNLIKDVISFLAANPSETIIMSLKREGVVNSSDAHFSKILRQYYINDPDIWYTVPKIPTLGEARKKIVLMRRFNMDESLNSENGGAGWGIDGSSWPDNCEDGICSSGDIRVQDFYEVQESMNIEKKIKFAESQLERAASVVCALPGNLNVASSEAAKTPFFINFLTASNFFSPACWPDRIAAKVNPHIIDFLCRRHNDPTDRADGSKEAGDGCTGIVVCDWVGNNGDWDLVRCIVGHNAKLELRENMAPR